MVSSVIKQRYFSTISRFTSFKKRIHHRTLAAFFCFAVCQLVCWLLCCSQCTAKWTVHRLWQPIPTTRASPRVSPLFPKLISKIFVTERKTETPDMSARYIKGITERTDTRTLTPSSPQLLYLALVTLHSVLFFLHCPRYAIWMKSLEVIKACCSPVFRTQLHHVLASNFLNLIFYFSSSDRASRSPFFLPRYMQ